MRKKKLIKKMFEEFERRYEPIVQTIYKCDAQQIMLLQKVERVLDPFKLFVKKVEFQQITDRNREYTAEVESKISNEWYNHVGLVQKLNHHFGDLIEINKNDIKKIKEVLKTEEESNKDEYYQTGTGIWRKK